MSLHAPHRPRSFPRLRRLLCGITIAAASQVVAAGPPMAEDAPRTDLNPTTAKVPSPPPAIRDPFTDDEYAKLAARAMKAIGPAPAVADAPTHGLRITEIEPDSPAAAAGLHAGDVIVAIDNQPTPTREAAQAIREKATGPQTLDVLVDGQPARRQVKVDPGRLGIDTASTFLLEHQYLHDLPAGVAPVDEVRIAARYASRNPPLAESALARAKKAGGPGVNLPIVDAIAAATLYSDNWYEGALAYAQAAAGALPKETRGTLNRIRVDAAYATFRYPLIEPIAKEDPRYAFAATLAKAQMETYELGEHAAAPEPNPLAAKVVFTDHTKDVVNLAPHVNGEFECSAWMIDHLIKEDKLPFRSPDGNYFVCHAGPGGANVSFSANCHFRATDNGHSGFVKVLRVGVASNAAPEVTFELSLDGTADATSQIGAPDLRLNVKRITGDDRTFALRMAVVGGRYELALDGRRIFYGPMPPAEVPGPRNLTLAIQTVGLTGAFSDVHWQTAPGK